MSFESIVLAGGLGTRLRTVVPDLPKVLAPVCGRPFIEFILAKLASEGCERAVLAVGYMKDRIKKHLGARFRGMRIDYSPEEVPLGTGGAAAQAMLLIDGPDALLMNGDTWSEANLMRMVAAHRTCNAAMTIAVRQVEDISRYGSVQVTDGRVVRFLEKGASGRGFINAGVYVLRRDLFAERRFRGPFSLESEFLAKEVQQISPMSYELDGTFIDIGVPDDYKRAQSVLKSIAETQLR